MEIFVACN